MDYKNGKIYRIVCNETGLCYVGSTTQTLTKRLSYHISSYKKYLKKKSNYVTSYNIFENKNYDIVLIEEYSCENKQQLHARERYYIDNMECVNKFIPTRTKQEYYEDNKEKILEYQKERRNGEKKEEILQKKKNIIKKIKKKLMNKRENIMKKIKKKNKNMIKKDI